MRTMMQAENAQVVVLNDTTTAGLANTVADWLRAQGVTVSLVSNTAAPSNGLTVLRNVNGKTWTTRYIASRLGLPTERVTGQHRRGGEWGCGVDCGGGYSNLSGSSRQWVRKGNAVL
ncbi:MAG UNVERIFIED_CONTAM: LytR C-terminal domain-containing protein [Anaerolineae bacterium]|jgi:hypothetical protein